jgi:hypothetical protein
MYTISKNYRDLIQLKTFKKQEDINIFVKTHKICVVGNFAANDKKIPQFAEYGCFTKKHWFEELAHDYFNITIDKHNPLIAFCYDERTTNKSNIKVYEDSFELITFNENKFDLSHLLTGFLDKLIKNYDLVQLYDDLNDYSLINSSKNHNQFLENYPESSVHQQEQVQQEQSREQVQQEQVQQEQSREQVQQEQVQQEQVQSEQVGLEKTVKAEEIVYSEQPVQKYIIEINCNRKISSINIKF